MKRRQLPSMIGAHMLSDPDQFVSANPAWPALKIASLSKKAMDFAFGVSTLQSGRLLMICSGTAIRAVGQRDPDHCVIRFPLTGSSALWVDGKKVSDSAAMEIPPGASTRLESGRSVSLQFQIPKEKLARLAAADGHGFPVLHRALSVSAADSLSQLAVWAYNETNGSKAEGRGVFARNLEELLVLRWASAILEQSPEAPRPEQRVGRCKLNELREWMELERHDPLTLADLTAHCGLGLRALENNFRRYFDTSPHEFLRNLRLEKARKLIRAGGCTVTEAAFDAGFVHLGHFAAAYRCKFGELPGITAARRAKRR